MQPPAIVGAAASLLATAGLTALPSTGADAALPSAAPPSRATVRTVTLVTGDKVRVEGQRVTFVPGPASSSTSAIITKSSGGTLVVPSAAVGGVRSGRLDTALFDVKTLLTEGYDDSRSATVPVIVEYAGTAALSKARALPGTTASRVLASIGARAAQVRKTAAGSFWESVRDGAGIETVRLDHRVRASLDRSVPQLGVPASWKRGRTGKGVKVAVLDTGIDLRHPDLAGRVEESANFSGAKDVVDHFGHGTHVAGIIAGSGKASGGKLRGVAPDATLLNGKVLNDYGFGSESGIIAGMEWAAAHGAQVVNLSLGGVLPSDGTDTMSRAVNQISDRTGVLFVVAAGNCPLPYKYQVTSPGAADRALAVGGLERNGATSEWSCRGPRRLDHALKPELSAPGAGIVSARAAGTNLGDPVGTRYTTLTGTSMATPHVAGAAALAAQGNPSWKADQLKNRLMTTADPQPGAVTDQGAGRVDGDQATSTRVSVDTAELELGVLRWPRPAADVVRKTLTYRNNGSVPLTLKLSVSVSPAGKAPTLSTSTLSLPAHGSASVTVAADRAANGTGTWSGRISAKPSTADDAVHTTFGWYAEPELYDLVVKGVNRDGSPAWADVAVNRPDGGDVPQASPYDLIMADGTLHLRVAPGEYDLSSIFYEPATDSTLDRFSLVAAPNVSVHGDTTVTLDARTATPVRLEPSTRPRAHARERSMAYFRSVAGGIADGNGVSVSGIGAPKEYYATPTAEAAHGELSFTTSVRLDEPAYRAVSSTGGQVAVTEFVDGPRFTGTRKLVAVDAGSGTAADLATVRGKLAIIRGDAEVVVPAAQQAGAAVVLVYEPGDPGFDAPGWLVFDQTLTIPAMRTTRVDAARLLDQLKHGPVTVTVTGAAFSPYVYDLVDHTDGRIPPRTSKVFQPSQLVRVDETFGSLGGPVPMYESRLATVSDGSRVFQWAGAPFTGPASRTSYLSTDGVRWEQTLWLMKPGEGGEFHGSEQVVYRPGSRSTQRWLAPVLNSGLARGVTAAQRFGDEQVRFLLQPFTDSSAHGAYFGIDTTTRMTLRKGSTVLYDDVYPDAFLEPDQLPLGDPATLRLDLDVRRSTPWWQRSTRTVSSWDVQTTGRSDEVFSMVFADLGVPEASDTGTVRTGVPSTITLGLRHQTGAVRPSFTTRTLEYSYDGKAWTPLTLVAAGTDRFVATVNHPVTRAGQSVDLRLVVKDAAGNALRQQITKAYGLS